MLILTFKNKTLEKEEKVIEFLKSVKCKGQKVLIGENGNVYEVVLFDGIESIPQWELGKMKILPIAEKDLKTLLGYWARSNHCTICSVGN